MGAELKNATKISNGLPYGSWVTAAVQLGAAKSRMSR